MNTVNTRELVLDVLLAVTRDGEYSHIVLSDTLEKYQYLEKQERAFITKVAEGTLERMIQIDYIINSFSNTKVNKMKPVIRCILRSAVYQICFLDGVPDSAACNEAVNLAGKRGFRNLKGFVNGVLRNIARNKENIAYPDEKKQPNEAISVRYSIPLWLVEQWEAEYGAEKTKQMAESLLKERPLSVRVNLNRTTKQELSDKLKAEGVEVTESKELPYALYLSDYDYLNRLQSFRDGDFYVQNISSMMVADTAQPKKGDVVLDVCAAPGGKSIHIAQLLEGTGEVIARDLTPYKVQKINENIQRCRVTNMRAECADARVFDEHLKNRADIVIADLPCSGLGVIGRKKDIKYKMTPEKEKDLVRLQREILAVVPKYLKSGGTLIYSTCTVHREENEENVKWLLEQEPDLRLETMEQIFPDESGRDGFFIARLRKM